VVRQDPRPWCPASQPTIALAAAPALSPASQPPAKSLNDAERDGQRQERALRPAITPPIAAAALEARSGMVSGEGADRCATCTEGGQLPAAIVPGRGARSGPGCHRWPVAGAKLGGAVGPSAGCPGLSVRK
jgi:hypothetical protein